MQNGIGSLWLIACFSFAVAADAQIRYLRQLAHNLMGLTSLSFRPN